MKLRQYLALLIVLTLAAAARADVTGILQLTSTNHSVTFAPANGGGARVDLHVNATSTNYVIYTNPSVAPFVVYTNFVSGTIYSNGTGYPELVKCDGGWTLAGGSGSGTVTMLVSNAGWPAYSNVSQLLGNIVLPASSNSVESFSPVIGVVSNGGTWQYQLGGPSFEYIGTNWGFIYGFNTVNAPTNQFVINNSQAGFTLVTNGESFSNISNAIYSGGHILFQPGDYYNLSNFVLTSNASLEGYGGVTLHFSTNCTGWLFDESTNVQHFDIKGIRLTGDAFPANGYASSTFIQPYSAGDPFNFIPWYIGQKANTYTNRNGLRMNFSGNNWTRDCKFDGFGGFGVMGVGTNDLTQAGGNAAGAFQGNTVCSNWFGMAMISFNYDYVVPGASPGAGIGNNLEAEYSIVTGNHFDVNGVGYYNSCGNVTTTGNEFTGNYIDMYGWGNQNPGHGTTVGNTFNHSTYNVIIHQTQFEINANQFLAGLVGANYIVFDGPTSASFVNNHIGGGTLNIIVTNSNGQAMGPVSIVGNRYDGAWSAITIQTNLGPTPNGGTVLVAGNYSYSVAGDTDGGASSLLLANNGGAITNLNGNAAFYASNSLTPSIITNSITNDGCWIGRMSNQLMEVSMSNNVVTFTKLGP